MFTLNITCSVCKIAFKISDSNSITSCGHLYHTACLLESRLRSLLCPQCHCAYDNYYNAFLNFEDGKHFENVVNDFTDKLESSNKKIKELQDIEKNKDSKIDDIRRLYEISEKWRAELQDKICNLSHENKTQTENHSKELNIKLNEVESLKMLIETAGNTKDVDNWYDKIAEFKAENSKLKMKLAECETSKIIVEQKMEIQEKKFNQINSELVKHIEQSFLEENKKVSTENVNKIKNKRTRLQRKETGNKNSTIEDSKKLFVQENNGSDTTPEIADRNHTLNQSKERRVFQPDDCKLIITNFPKESLFYCSLEANVIFLAAKMEIPLVVDDILAVYAIKARNLSSKVSIVVEFKTVAKKIQFLKHKKILQSIASTKDILIKRYIHEDIYPIFMYANRKLRGNGYEFIRCINDKVIVKKKLNDPVDILIKSILDVDLLLLTKSPAKSENHRLVC